MVLGLIATRDFFFSKEVTHEPKEYEGEKQHGTLAQSVPLLIVVYGARSSWRVWFLKSMLSFTLHTLAIDDDDRHACSELGKQKSLCFLYAKFLRCTVYAREATLT